ncbi:MAG: CehA/McbA family metallohydrolase, partial [Verrucomicrobiota bacterium]
MNASRLCLGLTVLFLNVTSAFTAEPPPIITGIERQPLTAQVQRLLSATEYLGSPLPAADRAAIDAAINEADAVVAVRALQQVLDKHVLYVVHINPEMRVKVAAGPAKPELVEQGWRQFLVKVHNESGTTAALIGLSPNAESLFHSGSANTPSDRAAKGKARDFAKTAQEARWLDLQMFDRQPLAPPLSGLEVEYRIVQLYSRDAGKREAKISFNVGQGTQDLGFRNEVDTLFTALPAYEIKLGVRDENNKPTTAAFEVRDQAGRVYPSQAKRLAPDFAFHPQVYRADGESLKLPAGKYTILFARGPESIPQTRTVEVTEKTKKLDFKATRWIDPSLSGWWSGDHHIHAAGCAHYTNPTEGVHAPDMLRHCLGEDLKVGANLTWGPCFDYQKQFFTGDVDKVSTYPYLLRYDIEVSGFGSHRSGHLCLLRLRDQMYPGGNSSTHWPTLCLNTLRWAKQQGALVGPAHTGWGLQVPGNELPNYNRPRFDGIGANEYIMNVTHQVPGPDGKLVPAVDFLSMVDTPSIWELNIWYHTLNVGYRTRISGETDFPCIYGER